MVAGTAAIANGGIYYRPTLLAANPDAPPRASSGRMPPDPVPALTADQLEAVRRWIEVGAPKEGVVPGTAELLDACRSYPGVSNARRITFEYVMLKDVNDSPVEARELVRLIAGLPAKVNLIPFNPWPGAPYECSDEARIRRFSEIVFEHGISAPVRTPRGRDIMAACGQLKTASERARSVR